MLDTGRHQHRVQRLQLLHLDPGSQAGPALQDDVELIRAAVLPPGLLLLRLQADQL